MIHRGDFKRCRRCVVIAMLELEALEPRIQVAYKQGLLPASVSADVSLARLMIVELDRLLREALDIAIADGRQYYHVYAEATYNRRDLAAA